MKRRGTLALVEQSVMLLIFAVAAALCLRGFLAAELTARENEIRDEAVLQVRNVAEQLKYTNGKWGFEQNSDACIVSVRYLEQELPGLGKAEVIVTDREGAVLFSLPVAWQEVDGDEG